jgi:hypothetical protein
LCEAKRPLNLSVAKTEEPENDLEAAWNGHADRDVRRYVSIARKAGTSFESPQWDRLNLEQLPDRN